MPTEAPSPLREALEKRVTAKSVGTALVLAAGLHHFLGASLTQVGATMVVAAVVGLGDVVQDAYDVREAVAHGWNGALAFAGTGLLYALGEDPPLWFPVLFGSVGAWFLADALQTARHEGVVERERDGREVYREYVTRRVHETLSERPRTRRELRDALDADPEDVDAAVAALRERGVLVEAGSELRVDDGDESTTGRVAGRLAGLARRVVRPVTLAFGNGGDECPVGERSAGERGGPADAVGTASGSMAGPDDARDSTERTVADRDAEGERELSRN